MPKDVALRYQKIGLEKVLQDGPAAQRFVFTFRPDLADLLGSVRKAGLLVPPVLREAGGGLYQIVCGWRRIQAVRSLGLESIEALIGSKEELTDEACLRRSLLENRFHRGFNEIEKAMVFVRLQDEFPSFLPRLGDVLEGDLRFPQDASALEDRRFLLSLPEPTRLRIATGQLSYGQALLLREFPAGCRDLFCDLMAGCALNLQESRQAAQWIREVSLRESEDPLRLLESLRAAAALDDRRPPRKNAQVFLAVLRRRRYPTLEAARSRFETAWKETGLETIGIQAAHDPTFETSELRLQISAGSEDVLRERIEALRRALDQGTLRRVFFSLLP